MSPSALIGSNRLDLSSAAGVRPPPLPIAVKTWRVAPREENIAGMSWVVAIAMSCLFIGLFGVLQKEPPLVITLSGRAGLGASDANSTELTMAELHAMEETPEVVQEEVLPQVLDLVQPQEVVLDLPQFEEALVTEDMFTVPAAPRIEDALKPVDPAKPKPKAQPAPAQPRRSRASTTASGTQGGTQGSGGGNGGTSNVGSGGGKGKFPQPNYPSSARSRGVSGRVTLALSVSPAGMVEGASPVSSQGGFTSSELDTVASFVRRNWRFPTGGYRKHTVNIVFKLKGR